ncbi:glycosyl hydrolase family 28 protein [Paenibacillus glycanilyticus]|uniref:glycosyl hydrolase family 28 protein n=1 Tax=Paenibacillus glycanilyticus TaxID=126569 RepID=UPI003EBE181E
MLMNSSGISAYNYSENCPAATGLRLFVNGKREFLFHATVACFASFSMEGRAEIAIETDFPVERVHIRPLSFGIEYQQHERSISFVIAEPMNVFVEINDQKYPLFIFANPPMKDVPSENDPDVIYFKAGVIHEVGTLRLKSNQTLYIEGGAVVRGVIRATDAENIRICGYGVLDGSLEPADGPDRRHFVVLEGCRNVTMEGIILIETPHWMIVLGDCENVEIRNIKEIGHCVSSDGIDIVGSRKVLVEGVFLRNNDDCIAVKALNNSEPRNAKRTWANDVQDVIIRNSVMYSAEENGGNCLEIGFELRTGLVENIVFENIDVIAVHGFGSVFSIHNGDRALVRNVRYENIRIEHFYDKLIDIRVVDSPKWNEDKVKGAIRDIHFKNIQAIEQPFNSGYTCSLIGGIASSTVDHILIEDFYLNDKKINNEDDLWLHTKHANHIRFK